jgi:hypothetical protein
MADLSDGYPELIVNHGAGMGADGAQGASPRHLPPFIRKAKTAPQGRS